MALPVIVGVGHSILGRGLSQPLSVLTQQACLAAIADAGLSPRDVDGLATYPSAPYAGAGSREGVDVATVDTVINTLRIGDSIRWYAELSKGMIGSAVIQAAQAIAAGACSVVLVWRALSRPPGVYGQWSGSGAAGDQQFLLPYGCNSLLQWHALRYQRYLHLSGAVREMMAPLVVNSRYNATLNECAYFRDKPMTREDYLQARMVADPLCLLDCDIPIEGAAAIVLTSEERARSLPQRPVAIVGYAQNASRRAPALNYMLEDHVEAGAQMAADLWSRSGCRPEDMDAAQLYDGFSPTVLYWLEALGFCERGTALEFIQDDRITLRGSLPVNTFGGSLSEGRLHGMGHIIEAVKQLQGRAGRRQLTNPKYIVVTTGSPLLRGAGLVLAAV